MRIIKKIILHYSKSDYAKHDNIDTIREWHLVRKPPFNDVGYHYFIRKNGLVEKGRDISIMGAHCKGQNKSSIGICISGKSKFTEYQFIALNSLIRGLRIRLGGKIKIEPHSKYSSKICPNFDVGKFICKYKLNA